jgi:hypothetical protein
MFVRTEWYGAAALALLVVGCDGTVPSFSRASRNDARVSATIVTIRTTLQPSNETSLHTIVIGPDRARDTSEVERWRLFDLKQNRVLFIDDVEKAYRAATLQSLVSQPRDRPDAVLVATNERRQILGVTAVKKIIRRGGYLREVWFGEHPAIPPQLFAMMEASEGRPSLLLSSHGFPLLDHAEVPYGKEKLVTERAVVSVTAREVPAALLEIPRRYRDLTEPAAGRRSVASRLRDRRAPAAESPPSSTAQTTP